ncbi:MAG: hypothetical protein GY822_09705 [Deltaproteobacteria bacterium]|nr:hypothetical protein [Deltaproteobacteria bacterium]
MRLLFYFLLCVPLCIACDASAPPADGGAPQILDAGDTIPPVASDYCEIIAPFFCDYYLRCERMAGVETTAECEAVFLSSCNDGYEQRYTDLENEELLSLSSLGIERCQQHLQNVDCAEQIRDLDGPCAEMWEGSSPPGSECGLDVEGFI